MKSPENFNHLVSVIENELGKKTSDIYFHFYQGDSFAQQLQGASDLLTKTVGYVRCQQLLKPFTPS